MKQQSTSTITTIDHGFQVGDFIKITPGGLHQITDAKSTTFTVRRSPWYIAIWFNFKTWLFGLRFRIIIGTWDRTVELTEPLWKRIWKR